MSDASMEEDVVLPCVPATASWICPHRALRASWRDARSLCPPRARPQFRIVFSDRCGNDHDIGIDSGDILGPLTNEDADASILQLIGIATSRRSEPDTL